MANTATNVSTGKPGISGSVYRAVRTSGMTLPTTAGAALDAAYKCMGYISDDGVRNSNEIESGTVKAWGGDVVLSFQNGRTDTFRFKMMEVMNEDVLKAVYVDENVTVTPATNSAPKAVAVQVNNTDQPESVWVIDMILRDGNPKRIVVPYGKITELSEIVYKDDEATGYEVTLTASADENGNTHYEYMNIGTATA